MRARITLREIPTYLERYSYNRMESGLNARRDMAKINRSLRPPDPPRKKRGEEWNEKEPVAGEN